METTNEMKNAVHNGEDNALNGAENGAQRSTNFIQVDHTQIAAVHIRRLITTKKGGGLNYFRTIVELNDGKMLPVYGSILKESLFQLDVETVRNDIMTGIIPVFIIKDK